MCVLNTIKDLLNEKKLSQKDLTDFLGISKNVFTEWKAGRNKSYKKYLPKIAEFFGVSVDFLLGNTKDTPSPELSDRKNQLLIQYDKLNNHGKDKIDEYMSDLLDNPKYIEQQFVKNIANEIKTSLSTPKLKS